MVIRYFEERTVCKQTTKSVKRYLLSFACCIFVMLGYFLVPSDAQTFRIDDEVVAQNRGPNGKVIVRSNHWVSDPWSANLKGSVPNGTRGTIQRGPRRGPTYIWYEVEWDILGVNLVGWSAETVNGCQVIGPAEKADQRDVVTAALFDLELNKVDKETNHDYNGYGCGVSWKDDQGNDVYVGGHAGWDAQTKDRSLNQTFYSLTNGTIIADGTDNSHTIAIFDGEKTTLYLHASTIDPSIKRNSTVEIGDPLGTQGMEGNATGPHLHIEVHEGESAVPSWGTEDQRRNTEDPIPYLYEALESFVDIGGGALPNPDVNNDNRVDILDLLIVWVNIGKEVKDFPQADVNQDGIINKKDIIAVANALEFPKDAAAPVNFVYNQIRGITIRAGQVYIGDKIVSEKMVQQLLNTVRQANNGSFTLKRSIAMLELVLAAMTPGKTVLLANYPNPFNPETWIPYQLSKAAEVSLTIYDIHGRVVRDLDLGYQRAGIYYNQSRAAYWDGKNSVGEPVASGVYFYTLTAGDFTATRKMLIRK